MEYHLTPDEQSRLQEQGVIEDGNVVFMSIDLYRDMLGISTDEDYADSVKKCNEGIEQIEAEKGVPANEFFAKFNQRHGIQD